jgi:NAD(P)-dependent dehydrogenase (short-subunit alcohol dehydrogenase family)
MTLHDVRVVITGAGRDFGRTLGLRFAEHGAEVILTSRNATDAERTRDEIIGMGHEKVHALRCDLSDPVSIRTCAQQVSVEFGHIDIMIHNGAAWLEGHDLWDAEDGEIVQTITSGVGGIVMMTKHFLPLLRLSGRPDIVTLVSMVATPRGDTSHQAHPAFYAAKGGQANFVEILSQRLREEGIRVISLYPPDFDNVDPMTPDWDATPRTAESTLTAHSLVECVLFAVRQPRDCFIRSFHFEPVRRIVGDR